MANIIKEGTLQQDNSVYLGNFDTNSDNALDQLPDETTVAIGKASLDSAQQALLKRGNIAVILATDDNAFDLAPVLDQLAYIAIEFPVFGDGRGYSIARVLRDQLGYQGDIRAIGDVLPDQLSYMQRCGFSSFKLRDPHHETYALSRLEDFAQPYQYDVCHPEPLFRRQVL